MFEGGFFLDRFKIIVQVIVAVQFLWSVFGSWYLWRKWRLLGACLFFAAIDAGILWVLIKYLPALDKIGKGFLWWLIMLLTAQVIFNGLVTMSLLARFIIRRVRRVPMDFKRRDMLKKSFVYPLLASGVSAYGGLVESHRQEVREIEIPVKGLTVPSGYRILQLSDVHLGPFFSLEDFAGLLRQAVEQKPDLLAVTGDVFDDAKMNSEAVRILDSFVSEFPDGIYYVYGNHEHYRGFGKIKKLLAGTHIRVLRNTASQVPGKKLCLAGVDYPLNKERFAEIRQKHHKAAMAKVPQGMTTVLLAHHPECIDDGAASGVTLTLTGHTHGCQFGFLGVPLVPLFRYNRGLVKIGDSYGYVHSGNGSWFPCRIGCPPEIVTFTLKAK